MSHNPQHSDWMPLFNSLVGENISADEIAQLEQILAGNTEAQDELLAYCQLHIDLMVELGADRATRAFCDRQSQFASLAAPILMPDNEPSSVIAPNLPRGFGAFSWWVLGGLTLCAFLVAGGLTWFGAGRPGAEPIAQSPVDQSAVDQSPVVVESSNAPTVTSMQLGSDYAEIGLAKIGRVTIHYPADFRLVGPMRARLNHGQIKVEVTEETGRGFIVETPDGEVTDLGTEFGLDVRQGEKTGLVVLDGKVDLRVAATHHGSLASNLERLVKGDGVLFQKDNSVDRIMSVISDERGLFRPAAALPVGSSRAVIAEVVDNLTPTDTKRYYEIVAGGLREDAITYVDRLEHNWNGVDQWGMPSYLMGADYVKTFNDDKHRKDFGITLVLARPAKVYVLLDDRIEPPDWLKDAFRDTGDKLGLDAGAKTVEEKKNNSLRAVRAGIGSGVSIDATYSIWERIVDKPGTVALGANGKPKNPRQSYWASMYAVAATELKSSEPPSSELQSRETQGSETQGSDARTSNPHNSERQNRQSQK